MPDFGPPIQLHAGPGGVIKIKRGGAARNGNSGSANRRTRTACFSYLRDRNKPGKHGGGTLLPKPPASPVIWNPTDPFVIAYQADHARYIAQWRTEPRVVMYSPTRLRPRKKRGGRIRTHFDFLDARRPKVVVDIETRDA